MSGSADIALEQAILGHTLGFSTLPATTSAYVALCAAGPASPPSEAAHGVEVVGDGYTRVPATFALAASAANVAANVSTVEFPSAVSDWGNVGYFELWDAVTGGNRLYWGQIIDPATGNALALIVSAGDIVRFSSGALAVQAATGSGTPTGTVGAYLPLAGGTLTGPLLLAADPGTNLGAATKQYVDAHSGTGGGAGFLPISGGTLTGVLTLVGDAAAALQPVSLQQMQAAMAPGPWLPLAGGTLTGALTLAANAALPLQPVTLQQMQAALPSGGPYLPLAGGIVSGNLTVQGISILHATSVNGSFSQSTQSFAGSNIDVSIGGLYSKTISGATTLTLSNVPASGMTSFILELTNGGSAAVTWWAGITWAGGTAPVLTASGVDVLGFYTPNGGSSWRGLVLGKGMA